MVTLDYDFEKEKFSACCPENSCDSIRFFPASATSKLEENPDALPAYIDHIEEDADGVYSVYVIVFFPENE